MKKVYYILLMTAVSISFFDLLGQNRRPDYRSRYSGRNSQQYQQNTPSGKPNNTSAERRTAWRNLTEAEQLRVDNCRKAILQDDPSLLQKAMGDNFDLNITNSDDETLLYYAVKERRMNCLRFLLEKKANVNCPGKFGFSPLFLCSRDNDAKIADLLIRAGAKTFYKDKNSEWTVFHKAAAENMGLDTLTVLMREKSGLNIHDRQGRTPLHLAVSRSPRADFRIVEFLLKNGAEVNALDGHGRTPLDLTRQKDIVKLLIQYHGRSNKNNRSYSRSRRKSAKSK